MIDIVKGHLNEMFNLENELSEQRMTICRECPLFVTHKVKGLICNPLLWLDIERNTASTHYVEGAVKGCGCRLEAKTRVVEAHCPCNKW